MFLEAVLEGIDDVLAVNLSLTISRRAASDLSICVPEFRVAEQRLGTMKTGKHY